MRILFVGDIVGKAGREAAHAQVPRLRAEHRADFVLINAENAAGGLGVNRDIAQSLLDRAKVDVITLGNHAFAKREVYGFLDEELRILRPANFPPGAPGRGLGIYRTPNGPVAVIVLQGRVFMEPIDDPFRTADDLLEEAHRTTKVVFVEIHGEATSEKQAMGWYLDGRASAVIGTHTHVQTADQRILPRGTAYLSDAGMTGPFDSVIGMKREIVVPRFLNHLPAKFEVAEGPAILCGVIVDIDSSTGRGTRIEPFQVRPEPKQPNLLASSD